MPGRAFGFTCTDRPYICETLPRRHGRYGLTLGAANWTSSVDRRRPRAGGPRVGTCAGGWVGRGWVTAAGLIGLAPHVRRPHAPGRRPRTTHAPRPPPSTQPSRTPRRPPRRRGTAGDGVPCPFRGH